MPDPVLMYPVADCPTFDTVEALLCTPVVLSCGGILYHHRAGYLIHRSLLGLVNNLGCGDAQDWN